MELRLLKYFIEAANELSITRAAQRLHITQPSLSRQLGTLEREIGRKLYVRESYGIRLTQDGILFRKRAQEIIDLEAKTLQEFSQTDKQIITGTVYIGAGETAGVKHIGKILRELRSEYPAINYRMISGDFEDIAEKLGKGLIDFGLFVGKVSLRDYNIITLPYTDTWGVIVKNDDPLTELEYITPDNLRDKELLFSHQAQTQGEFSEWLGFRSDELNITGTHNLAYNASVMVREGLGVLITIDGIISTGSESGLKFIPLMPEMKAELILAWKKEAILSKAAQKFLQDLRKSLQPSQEA
ncbi:MAG: LysR family transcriptional regulator [Synergistaceae bacterium]|nr:LysR family transcriptional regulator [Synergistaceae bacterium]